MWILAQFQKAVVLLPLECVTCHPAHAHNTDRGAEMASFCLLILQKKRNLENMFKWVMWFMFWLLLSSPTTTTKKTVIHQTLVVSSSAYSRVIFYLFLARFAFGWCCLDDNFEFRMDYLFGLVPQWYGLFGILSKSKKRLADFRWYSHLNALTCSGSFSHALTIAHLMMLERAFNT